GIADLDKGAVQLEAFAAVQKFEDEGFRLRLGHSPPMVAVADMRRFLEKELHGDVEDLRDLEQPARPDAVHTLLVLFHLLTRQSHTLAETLLTHAQQHSA